MILGSLLDPFKLLEVVLAALVSGVAVTSLFGLAVLALARISERRTHPPQVVAGYAVLASLSLGGCLAAIVYGILLLARH